MTSTGRAASNGCGECYSIDQEDHLEGSLGSTDQGKAACASGCSQPHQPIPVVTVTKPRSSMSSGRSSDSDEGSDIASPRSAVIARCENPRHGSRTAELYCRTCCVPICVACATTRHPRTSGHDCWDIEDAVDHCRTVLAGHATQLAERHQSCLDRIDVTNARIESIRSETDEQETLIRYHFEDVRMRLEQDLNRLIQDLELNKNGRIRELKKIGSELQATAVKLEGQIREFQQISVEGTAVEVLEECASERSAIQLDLLSVIPEPADHAQLRFTKSALLQLDNNLMGQFTAQCAARMPKVGDNTEERKAGEWRCESCTFINQDKDIECQMCAHAPWKEKLIGIQLPVIDATGARFGQNVDQSRQTWTCNICTLINEPANNACTSCGNIRPADTGRRSPNVPEFARDQPPPPPYRIPNLSAGDRNRAPSPGKILGTMNEATQTEEVDAGNPAQRVFGRIRQLVAPRRTSTPSPDSSTRERIPEMTWPTDITAARWPCSQCNFLNSVNRTECEKCGFEDASPSVTLPSH